jgi:hypothetical protein
VRFAFAFFWLADKMWEEAISLPRRLGVVVASVQDIFAQDVSRGRDIARPNPPFSNRKKFLLVVQMTRFCTKGNS